MTQTVARQLTRAQARRLTDRIKAAIEDTWLLIHEAHDGQAWAALDYDSWESFVNEEFGISRGTSYRMIDQGRVIQELAAAADIPAVDLASVVSERAAKAVKPVLDRVAEQVEEAVHGTRKTSRPDIVAGIIEAARDGEPSDVSRARHAPSTSPETKARSTDRSRSSDLRPANPEQLAALLPRIVATPVRDVLAAIPKAKRRHVVEGMRAWGNQLADELEHPTHPKGCTCYSCLQRPAPESCRHPVGRRLGDRCGACGAAVKR